MGPGGARMSAGAGSADYPSRDSRVSSERGGRGDSRDSRRTDRLDRWLPSAAPAGPSALQQLGVRLEPPAPRRVPELAQRLGLDLPDAFAGHVEERADLLERPLRPVIGEPEAQSDDLRLAGRQRAEDVVDLVAEHRRGGRVRRADHARVLDEIAQVRVVVLADRAVERDRLLRRLEDTLDLVDRKLEPLRDLLRGRLAAQLLHQP